MKKILLNCYVVAITIGLIINCFLFYGKNKEIAHLKTENTEVSDCKIKLKDLNEQIIKNNIELGLCQEQTNIYNEYLQNTSKQLLEAQQKLLPRKVYKVQSENGFVFPIIKRELTNDDRYTLIIKMPEPVKEFIEE